VRLLAILLAAATITAAADPKAEADARQAMDRFMTAFNSRNVEAWADTLNYPHVRFASNTVKVWPTRAEFIRENATAWDRIKDWNSSRWDSMQVVQSGKDKVHFAVKFTRFDKAGKVTEAFDSLYVVTLKDGHWGVQARSSFAP
jgi:hypothetical protein